MPAFRGKNLRSGDLAEQLGFLLLQSVVLVAPVPRTDDVGIDVVCTLLRNFDAKRLIAEDSFFVQIKSASVASISFKREEVKWLYDLDLPFFVASADRNLGRMKLYCAHRLFDAFITNHDRKSLTIHLEEDKLNDDLVGKNDPDVKIGPPILEWFLETTVDKDFQNKFYNIAKEHIRIAKESLRAKAVGYAVGVGWKTNEMPYRWGSKFTSSRSSIENLQRAEDAMAPYFNAWIMELMATRNWGLTPESMLSLMRKTKRLIARDNLAEGRPDRGDMEAWVTDLKTKFAAEDAAREVETK